MGLVIPAYAQDPRADEREQQIAEELRECKTKIHGNDELTDAEKTVAIRNCEREITIRYSDEEMDFSDQAQLRAKLQNLQRCEDWYPQYRYLTEDQFKIQKTESIVRDCILLYNESIWNYDGKDRLYKLIDALEEIKSKLPDSEPVAVPINIEIPQFESSLIEVTPNQDRVSELEEKVKLLEEELAKKDQVIREQLKTIMDLFNRIKNVIFEPIGFVWSHA